MLFFLRNKLCFLGAIGIIDFHVMLLSLEVKFLLQSILLFTELAISSVYYVLLLEIIL